MKKLKIKLQSKYLFKITAIIIILFCVIITSCYPYKSKFNQNETNFEGVITKINIDGNKLSISLKSKEILLVNYYIKTNQEKKYYQNNLSLGDVLIITGTLEVPTSDNILNTFNYSKYLANNKIYYLLKANHIEKKKNNESLYYYVKMKVLSKINRVKKCNSYLKTFILGDKTDLDKEVLTSYQVNGISHLFCISGMHISLFAGVIFFIIKKISYNNFYNYGVVITFLLFYSLLVGLTASVLRSFVMFILFAINKLFHFKIKSFDIILLTLIIILIYNPFMLYNVGFQFSYLTVFFLFLFSNKIKLRKNYFTKALYTSYLCFLVSLPLCLLYFYQISLLSILLNLIFIPFVSIIIFPLSLFTFIFPIFDNILFLFIHLLETISLFINKLDIFYIILPKPNLLLFFFYYIVIILSLYNYKFLILLILGISFHKFLAYQERSIKIMMLDVGQGDSLLVRYPHNRLNILIDTGGLTSYNSEKWQIRKNQYSLVKNKTIPYLKSVGITKLDYLIITHGDYDHMGEAINLINNFKIKKVIFNVGSYNDLEKELIKVLQSKKIQYYKNIESLDINKNNIYFLNTKNYEDENNNSNVLYTKINKIKLLFMGDAGKEKETDILEKYNLNDIDILKVGHHGSDTSSSEKFISSLNPKSCFISVGKNNRYGHPNKSVLNILNNCNIYRTDLSGSIEIEIIKNNYFIKTINS